MQQQSTAEKELKMVQIKKMVEIRQNNRNDYFTSKRQCAIEKYSNAGSLAQDNNFGDQQNSMQHQQVTNKIDTQNLTVANNQNNENIVCENAIEADMKPQDFNKYYLNSQFIQQCKDNSYCATQFPEMIKAIKQSNDIQLIYQATVGIAYLIDQDYLHPIQLIHDNLCASLKQFIECDMNRHLTYECWTIFARIFYKADFCDFQAMLTQQLSLSFFNSYLEKANDEKVIEAIMACLGNICESDQQVSIDLLRLNVANSIIHVMRVFTAQRGIQKTGIWGLVNMLKNLKDQLVPLWPFVYGIVSVASKFIIDDDSDLNIISDSVWGLNFLSDGEQEQIQAIIQSQVIPSLFSCMLQYEEVNSILLPCIRTIGNISTGTSEATQILLDCNMLQTFELIMSNPKNMDSIIQREACWALSNVAAGTEYQVSCLIQNQPLMERIMFLLNSGAHAVKTEILFMLFNMFSKANPVEARMVIEEYQVADALLGVLMCHSNAPDIIQIILKIFALILQCGQKYYTFEGHNLFKDMFDSCGVSDYLQSLQDNENHNVFVFVQSILHSYYDVIAGENDDCNTNEQ